MLGDKLGRGPCLDWSILAGNSESIDPLWGSWNCAPPACTLPCRQAPILPTEQVGRLKPRLRTQPGYRISDPPLPGLWAVPCSTPHKFLPRAGRIPSRHARGHCLLPPGYVALVAEPTIGCRGRECASVHHPIGMRA